MSRKFFAGIKPSRSAPVELDTGVATADFYPPGGGTAGAYNRIGIPFQYRTRDEFERFLTGLHLVPPGIVPMGGMAGRRRAAAAPVTARGRRLRGRRP